MELDKVYKTSYNLEFSIANILNLCVEQKMTFRIM